MNTFKEFVASNDASQFGDTPAQRRKVWEFLESRPFYNKNFMPMTSTAAEIYQKHIANDPEILKKFSEFQGSGLTTDHPREIANRKRIERLNSL